MIKIYHNGECSKCRGALELLQEMNIPHEVRWYLAEPLNAEELRALLVKLDMSAIQLVRKSEPLYKEQFEGKDFSDEEWLHVLADNPILMERPVVEKDNVAIVARPAERVLEML